MAGLFVRLCANTVKVAFGASMGRLCVGRMCLEGLLEWFIKYASGYFGQAVLECCVGGCTGCL